MAFFLFLTLHPCFYWIISNDMVYSEISTDSQENIDRNDSIYMENSIDRNDRENRNDKNDRENRNDCIDSNDSNDSIVRNDSIDRNVRNDTNFSDILTNNISGNVNMKENDILVSPNVFNSWDEPETWDDPEYWNVEWTNNSNPEISLSDNFIVIKQE